jgi:Herpesviridae UL52/UL70 DNA primase
VLLVVCVDAEIALLIKLLCVTTNHSMVMSHDLSFTSYGIFRSCKPRSRIIGSFTENNIQLILLGMVEAVWDPVAKKVVFVKEETTEEKKVKRDNERLIWRVDNNSNNDDSPSAQGTRRRPLSQGAKPSHPITPKVEELHKAITKAVISRKTQAARAAYDCQRRVYNELSSYKTFPLQELRIEWGVDPDEDISASIPDVTSCTSSSTTSSITSMQPEPKRHISDHIGSPGHSIQHLKESFLQQRESLPNPAVFTNPLYSLEPRIWGMEAATTGKRKYVVAHAGRFFDHYWRKTIPADRHWYELIRPTAPCRLYLDIECSTDDFLTSNVALQHEVLYELWLLLQQEIEDQFRDFRVNGKPLALLNRRDHLIDLENNSSTKFSRHWIFHLKTTDNVEVLFPNNLAVGTFVSKFISKLADDPSWREDHPVLSKYLFVSNTCLLDLGVYTRNRIFRLLGSCKFGKPATLHISRSNQFDLGIANDCVVRSVDPDTESDVEEHIQDSIRRTIDWSDHARALANTLVVPLNSSKLSYPLLPIYQEDTAATLSRPVQHSMKNRTVPAYRSGQSNYRTIEEYVMKRFGHRGGAVGRVRVSSIFEDRILSLHMVNNRWCENVGRQHKSNNIVWNVDLVTHVCYQSCHDPDCRGFRGKVFAVPDELFATSIDDDDDFFGDEAFEAALASLNVDDIVAEFLSRKGENETGGDDSKRESQDEVSLPSEHDSPRRDTEKFASWLGSDDSEAIEEEYSPRDQALAMADGPLELSPLSLDRTFTSEGPGSVGVFPPHESKRIQCTDSHAIIHNTSTNEGTLNSELDNSLSTTSSDNSCQGTDLTPAREETKLFPQGDRPTAAIESKVSVGVETDNVIAESKFASWLDSPDIGHATLNAIDNVAANQAGSIDGTKRLPSVEDANVMAALSVESKSPSNDGFASWLDSPDNGTDDSMAAGVTSAATMQLASWLSSDSSNEE